MKPVVFYSRVQWMRESGGKYACYDVPSNCKTPNMQIRAPRLRGTIIGICGAHNTSIFFLWPMEVDGIAPIVVHVCLTVLTVLFRTTVEENFWIVKQTILESFMSIRNPVRLHWKLGQAWIIPYEALYGGFDLVELSSNRDSISNFQFQNLLYYSSSLSRHFFAFISLAAGRVGEFYRISTRNTLTVVNFQ